MDNVTCNVWTKTNDGYCTEVSTLTGCNVPMPGTNMQFPFKAANELRDMTPDNEVIGWSFYINGANYVVFND